MIAELVIASETVSDPPMFTMAKFSDFFESYPIEKLSGGHFNNRNKMCAIGVALDEGGIDWGWWSNFNVSIGNKSKIYLYPESSQKYDKMISILKDQWDIDEDLASLVQTTFDSSYYDSLPDWGDDISIEEWDQRVIDGATKARDNTVALLREYNR